MEDPGEDDDFYRMTLAGGERLTARMTATSGSLEPVMVLVDENLNFITDTFFDSGTDVRLTASIPKAGTYYLSPPGGRLRSPTGGPDHRQVLAEGGGRRGRPRCVVGQPQGG
jgi:hypothetical protein